VVTLQIGANDVAYSSGRGAVAACYAPTLPQVQANLTSIVQRIRSISLAHPVAVVLLDYWSVWLGGQYATAPGPAYVTAGTSLSYAESAMISAVARSTGSAYVDLRLAFRGPDDTDDETGLLAPDGDRPNAAGQSEDRRRHGADASHGVARLTLLARQRPTTLPTRQAQSYEPLTNDALSLAPPPRGSCAGPREFPDIRVRV